MCRSRRQLRSILKAVKRTAFAHLVLAATQAAAATLVADEALKIEILKAAFPESTISAPHQPILDWSPTPWPGFTLTDALRGEKEYEVVGTPDENERTWASPVVIEDRVSHPTRTLRIRAYQLAQAATPAIFVAVTHYAFTDIHSHPFCCEWFARVFLMAHEGAGWKVNHSDESLIYRAKTVRSFQLTDVDGDGRDEVLVEAENTAAGYRRWITMSVFRISRGILERIATVDTLSSNGYGTQFKRDLEVERSRLMKGKGICFKTTEYGTETEQYRVPIIKEEVFELSATSPVLPR